MRTKSIKNITSPIPLILIEWKCGKLTWHGSVLLIMCRLTIMSALDLSLSDIVNAIRELEALARNQTGRITIHEWLGFSQRAAPAKIRKLGRTLCLDFHISVLCIDSAKWRRSLWSFRSHIRWCQKPQSVSIIVCQVQQRKSHGKQHWNRFNNWGWSKWILFPCVVNSGQSRECDYKAAVFHIIVAEAQGVV